MQSRASGVVACFFIEAVWLQADAGAVHLLAASSYYCSRSSYCRKYKRRSILISERKDLNFKNFGCNESLPISRKAIRVGKVSRIAISGLRYIAGRVCGQNRTSPCSSRHISLCVLELIHLTPTATLIFCAVSKFSFVFMVVSRLSQHVTPRKYLFRQITSSPALSSGALIWIRRQTFKI